jgi:uncharacterized Zn finger protein
VRRSAPRGAAPRRVFGRTWWGKAWVDALEQRARLDPNRLPRGRTYARRGSVGALAVQPGEIRASVQGSRVTPYIVHVRVRVFEDKEWERLLDAIATKAAHTAALLDGELPPEIVADAAEVGVDLLPVAGEVGPRCSCPDWADPCKHAAAVVYLAAELLDEDPFSLLLLRGRTRDEVLAALRHRRASKTGSRAAAGGDRGVSVDPGVEARAVWSRARSGVPALPVVPLPPRRPGDPAPLAVDPPSSAGVQRADLAELAADAAERAWSLCLGEGDGGLALDEDLDLVRRAARVLRSPSRRPGFGEFAARAGVRAAELARRANAWRIGGADGVDVMGEAWSPSADALDEGRAAMAPFGDLRVFRNRLTSAGTGVQLRLSHAGAWYRFEKAGGGWELVAGPEGDPARALSALPVP